MIKTLMRALVAPIAFAFMLLPATIAGAASSTSPNVLYNSTIAPLSQLGNLPSVGAESSFFNEFGNQVTFASGNLRTLNQVTVTMSSWGCQSGSWYAGTCSTTPGATFSEPITFNIYNAPASGSAVPGTLIATATQTFNIPYRPSASTRCTGGRWYDSSARSCFNGLATNIIFTFNSLTVPGSVVFGIAYNTTDAGYHPVGTTACNSSSGGCGYDSLNIALSQEPPTVGTDSNPGKIFQNAVYAASYCDGGTAGTGFFRLDSPTCNWLNAPSIPAVQFKH
jgi:hypothetical protein